MTIEIADSELNSLMVGGRFKLGQFDAMLDVLEVSFDIEVARLGDQHIELHRPKDR